MTRKEIARNLRDERRSRQHPNYFSLVVNTKGRVYLFQFSNPENKEGYSMVDIKVRRDSKYAMYHQL